MTRIIIFTLSLMLSVPLFSRTVRADFFQYTDQDGTVVMVDDESKIPAKYRKKTRTTRAAPVVESTSTSVRLTRGNQALVPVRISYRNATVDTWLLLDTGATVTVISSSLADRLGITPANTQSRPSQLADGRVVDTARTRVDLVVGPKLKYNVEVAILPRNGGPAMGFDGLLGMDFLGEFGYHLDINKQAIEWH
jgi:predicted aspartyl protease